jgi:hypothetical protein
MGRLDDVKKTVIEISEHVKNGIAEDEIRSRYTDFHTSYPQLFKIVIENGNYMEGLNRMIDAAKIVERGEVSIDEMDKKVGFELAKEYIYPNIDMSKEHN